MTVDVEIVDKIGRALVTLLLDGVLAEGDFPAAIKYDQKINGGQELSQAEIDEMRSLIWPKYREQLTARGFDLSVTVIDLVAELLAALSKACADESISFDRKAAALYDDKYVAAFVKMRYDPVAFEQCIQEIARITGLGTKAVRAHVEKCAKEIQGAELVETPKEEPIPPEIEAAARFSLEHGDPVKERIDYVGTQIEGVDRPARASIYSEFSSYMSREHRQHCDIAGSSQAGKTFVVMSVMDTFPEGDSKLFTDVSPKFFYYWAGQMGERLEYFYIYLDDAREEHIPVLKAFRNEPVVKPSHGTIIEKEATEMVVEYRPVLNASSVSPLQDHEGQTPSRAFLITIRDVDEDTEKKIRAKIRERKRLNALLKPKSSHQLDVLRAQARILRDEGIKDVLMLFDVEQPEDADRRGTGQFMNFIMISAFIYQFQRPILEIDGPKYVLATYEDFRNAAELWFDFGQAFKINDKALEVLNCLPDVEKGAPTAKEITELLLSVGSKIHGQSSVEYYLKTLFEKGYVMRNKVAQPGAPYVWWKAISQVMLTREISAPGDISQQYPSNPELGKYMAKYSPDCLKKAYKESVGISEVNIRENKGKINFRGKVIEDGEEIISLLFSPKSTREMKNEPTNTEHFPSKQNLGIVGKGSEPPADSGISQVSKNIGNLDEVLVCRRIKKAIAEGITDPIKLAEVVGIPVCTLARGAARYAGIDQKQAGEILVTLGRASWWPPREPSIKEQCEAGEHEAQAREEHFQKVAEQPRAPPLKPPGEAGQAA